MEEQKKICFVISPIGEEGSDTRERSNQVLRHIISASAEQLGYTIIRADKISEPGIITTQIIEYIVDSDLVIADLTDKNPNVFYELAIRHATRKPLVQLIQKGEVIPFDVAATRIIQFDLQNLDSVANAKDEIISQVKSLENGSGEVHNPISVSLDLKVLKSGNTEERSLAEIFEAISEIRLTLNSVDKNQSSKISDELRSILEKLPMRIEDRLNPDFRKKRRHMHPIMLEEIFHVNRMKNPNLGFLMLISFLKDDFPWIYEVGLETYRNLKTVKSAKDKRELIKNFEEVLDTIKHPLFREMYGGDSEESYFIIKEMRHLFGRYIDSFSQPE